MIEVTQTKPQTTSQKQSIRQHQFQLNTTIGKIIIQTIILPNYIFLILTNSHTLLIDGSLQIGLQTPYQNNPTIIDIGADQNQASNQDLCRKISKQLGLPVVLSNNLEINLGMKDQVQVIKFLKKVINMKDSKENQKQGNI